jgi:two-component system phosphate regulon sensor histidine kinase PhoR
VTDEVQAGSAPEGDGETHSDALRESPTGWVGEVAGRLRLRKWLLASALGADAAFVAFAGLAWQWAALGGLCVLAAAALVPRQQAATRQSPREREKTQDLERDAERLSQIIETIPDPAILLTQGGTIVSFNARAARQYRDLRAGAKISSFVRNPDFLDALGDVVQAEAPITVSYMERVPVERRIDASLATLAPAAGGEAALVLACLRDLSEQERTNRMRQDFIANASHELRTPLAALIGFIETLQGPASKDAKTQKRFLGIMAQQASRMTRLIDDLLSLSRVEMKAHLTPEEVVDVGETVRHVIDMLEPLAADADLKLILRDDEGLASVRGDRDELVQLFQNLIQNAIKYGAEGDAVTVAIERLEDAVSDQPQIAVSVIDQGVGIAPDHLPRLTERFYRIDVASSRDKGGTGLGLAIVKHIVNRHRGELQISSQPGEGSTFRVALPLIAGEKPAEAGEKQPATGAHNAG